VFHPTTFVLNNKKIKTMSIKTHPKNKNNISGLFGFIIIIAGVLYLLKQFNVFDFDLEIWPMFLIAGGIVSGVKRGFDRLTPIILIAIGLVFLIPSFTIMGVPSSKIIWPSFLILSGIWIVLRTNKRETTFEEIRSNFSKKEDTESEESSKLIDAVDNTFLSIEAFFGGRKEIITSKQFSGCNATAICGGVEINLMQADNSIQPMVIDLRVVFGGIEIIVPSHWEVINEVDVLLGGIEDKRNLRTTNDLGDTKKLLLKGSVTFGGLELKSY
jgi:predicted membrane protein